MTNNKNQIVGIEVAKSKPKLARAGSINEERWTCL